MDDKNLGDKINECYELLGKKKYHPTRMVGCSLVDYFFFKS